MVISTINRIFVGGRTKTLPPIFMEKINLYGSKQSGKIKITNQRLLDEWTNELQEAEEVEISFIRIADLKSHRQLKLIYHCLREISEFTGYTLEETKLILKLKFGYCYSHTIDSKDITVCKSLSDFSKKDLSKFILEIDHWSSITLNLPLLQNEDIKFLS